MKRPHPLVTTFVFVFFLSAPLSAQEVVLGISAPPSGSLSQEELEAIASDIRRLEAEPYAADAAEARLVLFQWISGSPDVHVTICASLTGELLDSDSKYRRELFLQFILSSAAFAAENPEMADDPVAQNLGGFRGTLVMYNKLIEREGRRARDRFMQQIERRDRREELEDWVRTSMARCL